MIFCLVHALSFIICLYFLYTFINWHLNYFLYIVHVYDINLLIFCQCSNQPLIYPKIDLPGRENSKPLLLSSLPIFPSKYKPSLFLTFPVVFEIEEGAWEDLGMGCMEWMQLQKKKQDQTNFFEIHLTLLHIFYVLFHSDTWMSLGGTRTIAYSNSTITNQFCLEIICCRVCFSFDFLIYPYYPAYIG